MKNRNWLGQKNRLRRNRKYKSRAANSAARQTLTGFASLNPSYKLQTTSPYNLFHRPADVLHADTHGQFGVLARAPRFAVGLAVVELGDDAVKAKSLVPG